MSVWAELGRQGACIYTIRKNGKEGGDVVLATDRIIFLVIRKYAKGTYGLFAIIIGKISPLTAFNTSTTLTTLTTLTTISMDGLSTH